MDSPIAIIAKVVILPAFMFAMGFTMSVADSLNKASLVVGLFLGLAAFVGMFYGVKYRVTAEVNGANAQAWEKAAHRLQETVHEQNKAIAVKDAAIAKLEAMPRVDGIIDTLSARLDSASREHSQMIDLLTTLTKTNERVSTAVQLWATARAKSDLSFNPVIEDD
jgi:hypothetical protein